MAPHPDRMTALGRISRAYAAQWWALGLGLAACFLVLLATKEFGGEVRVFCALGAIVVILLWLATGSFRGDGMACAASSTLALLPIAALECGWVEIEGRGTVLLIETFCLAILFVGQVSRLGGEVMAVAREIWRPGAVDVMAIADGKLGQRSSVIVIRCCAILIGLLAMPSVMAATGVVAG